MSSGNYGGLDFEKVEGSFKMSTRGVFGPYKSVSH